MNPIINKIISILLVVVLFLGIFKTTFTISDFLINQDEIAKTLCVQKDNQQGCFGKCQLVKALKKDLEKETKAPNQKTEKQITTFNFVEPIQELNFVTFTYFQLNKIEDNKQYNILDRKSDIFIPPPIV